MKFSSASLFPLSDPDSEAKTLDEARRALVTAHSVLACTDEKTAKSMIDNLIEVDTGFAMRVIMTRALATACPEQFTESMERSLFDLGLLLLRRAPYSTDAKVSAVTDVLLRDRPDYNTSKFIQ